MERNAELYGTQLRLQVDVQQKGDELTGVLTSIDQGNAKIDLAGIVLDETTFSFTIPAPANAVYRGRVNAAGTVAEGEYRRGERVLPLNFTRSTGNDASPAEPLKEAWIGKLNGIAVVQFRIVDAGPEVNRVYFDSVTEGLTGFLGSWKREGNQLKFDIPGIQLNYTGELNQAGDAAEGLWRQAGRELQLTLNKSAAEVQNTMFWENRPQRSQPPFPYTAEEVRFANAADNLTLAGTLTLPEGPGPHPAVVLITGSGQQDRDEFVWQHRPFMVLADHLTRRGIAVLRYDDRGTAQSTGQYKGSTVVDFARGSSANSSLPSTWRRCLSRRSRGFCSWPSLSRPFSSSIRPTRGCPSGTVRHWRSPRLRRWPS